jgi:hypothetical protein
MHRWNLNCEGAALAIFASGNNAETLFRRHTADTSRITTGRYCCAVVMRNDDFSPRAHEVPSANQQARRGEGLVIREKRFWVLIGRYTRTCQLLEQARYRATSSVIMILSRQAQAATSLSWRESLRQVRMYMNTAVPSLEARQQAEAITRPRLPTASYI